MDNLNKYHKSKSQQHKIKCDKTNKELIHETFNYDNCPSETIPLLVNAINELRERIRMLENDRNVIPTIAPVRPIISNINNALLWAINHKYPDIVGILLDK
jgi:hypothetical protein